MTRFTRFSDFPARHVERGDAGHHKKGAPLRLGRIDLTHKMGHYLCTLVLEC